MTSNTGRITGQPSAPAESFCLLPQCLSASVPQCLLLEGVLSCLEVTNPNPEIPMEHFKRFFPQYDGNRLIGAVAGMVIAEEADKFAYRQGLFVITQTGETVQLLNDEKFQPKRW